MTKNRERTFSYGAVIIASCFLLQAVGLGNYIGFGVFINPLISEFGWSRAALSGATSIALLLSGVLSVVVGRISDRIGPRLIVLSCAVFFGVGHMLMSRVSTVWQLYIVYGLIIGTGLSCVDVIALSTTAQWFAERRGAVTGLVKVGAGFGHLTIPMLATILTTRHGWRVSFISLGAGSFLAFLIIGLLLRRAPCGAKRAETDKTKGVPEPKNQTGKSLSFKEAVRTKAFWIICIANLMSIYCLMSVMLHIVPHARSMTESPTLAAGILSTIGFVSMGGRLLTGLIIDRIGSKRTTMLCFILLAIVLLWLQIADAPWMLYLFAAVYGVAHGGLFTILSPIVADFFGVKSHGALFGIVVFFGTVGGALGPIVTGSIFDAAGSYHTAFWICTGVSLLGLSLIATLKPAD